MPDFESLLTRWIASASEYAIILIDPNGTILSWNEGARLRTGYPRVEIIGRPFSLLFPADDRRLVDDALKRARESGRFTWACWSLRKNGGLFWAQASAWVLRETGDPVAGYVITLDDTSSMKSVEEARQQ